MVIQQSHLEEIFGHLEVVQQLCVQIQVDEDEAASGLNNAIGELLGKLIEGVAPVLDYLDPEEFFIEGHIWLQEGRKCKGVELVVPEYRMTYCGEKVFNTVVVTTKGELATVEGVWIPNQPWYFLTLIKAAPFERLNLIIILLDSLVKLIKERLPAIKEKSEQVEEAKRWVDNCLAILHNQALN